MTQHYLGDTMPNDYIDSQRNKDSKQEDSRRQLMHQAKQQAYEEAAKGSVAN